jgi:hypothetical protein
MAHAAEIAFAFFPDVGSKENRDGRRKAGVAKGGAEAKQSGQARGVIAGSGSEDAGVDFGGFGGRARGENRVEVGGEQDNGRGSSFGI